MVKTVQFKGLPAVSEKQIIRYLKLDLSDDWFQDPLEYDDFILMHKEYDIINANFNADTGMYKPCKRELFYVPKSNFTIRCALETDYYDRWLYFYLVLPLIKKFDCLIPPEILSHRYNTLNEKYLFHNAIEQWSKFQGFIRARSKSKYIVSTDIQNYYENISIRRLESDLLGYLNTTCTNKEYESELSASIKCLKNCLISWSFNGEYGLPQNRDCSSFLANIYMLSIDNEMLSMGYDYYRYMDDIAIICDDIYKARKALLLLVNLLREKQLSVNSKKTKILSEGMEEYTDIQNPGFELSGIDMLLRTKRKANVAIGFQRVNDILLQLIDKNDYESRAFRFCIGRITKIARCKDYKLPNDYFSKITDGIVKSLLSHPSSTDQAYEYLSTVRLNDKHLEIIVDYLLNPNHSIYEWQNYWLYKLLIVKEIKKVEVLEYCLSNLANKYLSAVNRAAIVLYIAKFGEEADLIKIRNLIESNQSLFLQRHLLLSVNKLSWQKHMRQVSKEINPRMKGVYMTIKKEIDVLVKLPPVLKIDELLESVHQYD
jgi:hypothetical protein